MVWTFFVNFQFCNSGTWKNINHKIELCRDINGYGVISRAKCDQKAVFKINLFFYIFCLIYKKKIINYSDF